MTAAVLSDKAVNLLKAIQNAPETSVSGVAKYLGVTVASVTGTIAPLKKNEMVTITEGKLALTDAGIEAIGAAANAPSTEVTKTVVTNGHVQSTSTTTSKDTAPKQARSREDSKAAKAQLIFDQFKNEKRAVLMEKLMTEVGLTKNGANTYIYNMRKKANMVTPRAAAPINSPEVAQQQDTPENTAGDAAAE